MSSLCGEALLRSFLGLTAFSLSTPSLAALDEVINYLKETQIGFDYSNSIDRVDLSYDMDAGGRIPPSCGTLVDDPSQQRCAVSMIGGASNGWGLFLQPAFKNQGLFYLNWDLGIGARYLSGELPASEQAISGLPLQTASFSLAAAIIKPYLQLGITPEWWPDVLISLGPAIQVAVGSVAINGQPETVAVGTSSISGPMSVIQGFFQLEFVLRRFGDGAFSLVASHDVTGHGRGTQIYPGDIDGMSNFYGAFRRDVGGIAYGFGLKLLTPWP
jgi:hypothetical protein